MAENKTVDKEKYLDEIEDSIRTIGVLTTQDHWRIDKWRRCSGNERSNPCGSKTCTCKRT